MVDRSDRYRERRTRLRRAIDLEPVDRIPFVYMGSAFAPRYLGVSIARFCADPDLRVDVTLDAMDRLGGEFDGINSLPLGSITAALSGLWLSRVAVPGRDLPEDSLWQVAEAEVMTPADYDAILARGWAAFRREYLPRVADAADLVAHQTWLARNLGRIAERFRERGYAAVSCGATTIPFECLCGGRSMQEFFVDLHRMPDKVKAVLDVMQPDLVQVGIEAARRSGVSAVWVGGWRSASAMLSPAMWEEFVFPYLLDTVTRLAAHDITSILHFDQDWTRDLPRLRELPPRRCVLNLDGWTEIRRAKEVLGDHMALMGDVPAPLLAGGTPEDVRRYVRDLARDVGPTGLILCPGCDAPIDARPENMEAFAAACLEVGAAP